MKENKMINFQKRFGKNFIFYLIIILLVTLFTIMALFIILQQIEQGRGCSYNNPPCGIYYACQNNQCILKSGCQYNNPQCGTGHVCQNNQCVAQEQTTSTETRQPITSQPSIQPQSTFHYLNSTCNSLLQNGPMEKKLNIIFIPSRHYKDMAKFYKSVREFNDVLFDFPFYQDNKNKLNIFFLTKTNDDDECGRVGNSPTPYCDIERIKEFAKFCNYNQERGDKIVVIFDNDEIAVASRGEDIVTIGSYQTPMFVHELSHTLGLADTYDGNWKNEAEPLAPNCASDTLGFTCQDKWGNLIGVGEGENKVGCYKNCHAENWYRPTSGGDVMRDSLKKFYDAVSLEYLNALMNKYE